MQFPANVTFSTPDLPNYRYEEDLVWLMVTEKNWNDGVIFGKSFNYFSVAMAYAHEHNDQNFVVTLV